MTVNPFLYFCPRGLDIYCCFNSDFIHGLKWLAGKRRIQDDERGLCLWGKMLLIHHVPHELISAIHKPNIVVHSQIMKIKFHIIKFQGKENSAWY